MTAPNRSITIKNGGNGVSPGVGVARFILGTASAGSTATPVVCTAPNQVSDTYTSGPLVDCAKYELQNGGGTVICLRVPTSVNGTVEATAAPAITGDGTCTAAATGTGTILNRFLITIQIVSAGTLGTATFKYSLDDGPGSDEKNWSLPVQVPGGGTYAIPNTGVTLTFGAGPTLHFLVGDEYYFTTTAPAFQSADLATSLDIVNAYTGVVWQWVHVVGEITAAIAAVVSTKMMAAETAHKYRFAILEAADVGMYGAVIKSGTTPPDITMVSGVPRDSWNVKIKCTKAGARATSEIQYSLDGGNTYNGTAIVTAATINLGNTGMIASMENATAALDNTWTFSTWDKTEAAWIAALTSAYASFSSDRVMVCAGFGEVGLTDGTVRRRPIAWGVSALIARKSISDDIGQVLDVGPLPGYNYISHDESLVPGLDDLRFCTSRTWDKLGGYYVNQGRMGASAGSDYDLVQYRQVMDAACEALDLAMLLEMNRKIRVDAVTGYINEVDARAIEQKLTSAVSNAIVVPGHASGLTVALHRNDNLLSTRTLLADLQVVGLAYIKTFTATIGYKNPAIVPTT